jgi:hypothetical protein
MDGEYGLRSYGIVMEFSTLLSSDGAGDIFLCSLGEGASGMMLSLDLPGEGASDMMLRPDLAPVHSTSIGLSRAI